VTPALSVDTTFGYTDARYTKDAFPNGALTTGPNAPLPLAVSGDAIGGPNGTGTGFSIPPWSATIGAEYKFGLLAHESFVRVDYEYKAADKWTHATLDPRTSQYDQTSLPTPRQSFASLRAGTNLGEWAVSFFVDNLTDSHTITNFNHQTNTYDGAGNLLASPAYRYITYRPRTFGITATLRR
jgi:iron complex outermembrane receptor protein